MKRILMALVVIAALALPSLADARGFGGGGHSFGGGHSSFGGGRSSFGGGFGGGRASFASSPSRGFGSSSSTNSRSFGNTQARGFGMGRTTQTRSINYTANRNANYVANSGGGYGGGFGGHGFLTGMMVGNMMSHPYRYGVGMMAPPYAMGGYGYDVVGGYGLNGYSSGGAYYPYSPVGMAFSWIFGLIALFAVIYFTVLLLQVMWRIAFDE